MKKLIVIAMLIGFGATSAYAGPAPGAKRKSDDKAVIARLNALFPIVKNALREAGDLCVKVIADKKAGFPIPANILQGCAAVEQCEK